jgi:hypothetical protein
MPVTALANVFTNIIKSLLALQETQIKYRKIRVKKQNKNGIS